MANWRIESRIIRKKSDNEIREIILSKPSCDHLIPILKKLPYILIVEDFHYLKKNIQESIFQQWKVFVDNEVSVIVVGTTHHAVDIAFANKDLIGRISHLEINVWTKRDLKRIVDLGYDYLNIKIPRNFVSVISEESVGLPIIAQQICLQILQNKEIYEVKIEKSNEGIEFEKQELYDAFHSVATTRYSSFQDFYDVLATGIRRKSSKYNTYELMLLIFSLDPISFSVKRHEIDERLSRIPLGEKAIPPTASINSTLGNLAKLQNKKGIELLEWVPKIDRLFILQPAFLFFLRWKEPRKAQPDLQDVINDIFIKLGNINIQFSEEIKVIFNKDKKREKREK